VYQLDKRRAKLVLLDEGIDHSSVDSFIEKYPLLNDSLGTVVDQWLLDRQIPDLEIEGVSLIEVIRKRDSHFLKAIRDLNRLFDPTLTADQKANWKRNLTTQRLYE